MKVVSDAEAESDWAETERAANRVERMMVENLMIAVSILFSRTAMRRVARELEESRIWLCREYTILKFVQRDEQEKDSIRRRLWERLGIKTDCLLLSG